MNLKKIICFLLIIIIFTSIKVKALDEDGWITIDNEQYFMKVGSILKGIHEVDGKWYHFGENSGQLKIGWSKLLDGSTYYSNKDGVLQFGWVSQSNSKYFITRENGTNRGIQEIDGKWYHFGENSGQLKIGWSKLIDGRTYYSNKDGVLQFGWVNLPEGKYYITKENGANHGIQSIDGKWYHFGENSGQLKIGWSKLLDGRTYYSNKDGVLQFGWVSLREGKYYITKENGTYHGIQNIDGKWYHFGENSGLIKIGISKLINGKIYYSNDNGELLFGWVEDKNNKYFITKESGAYKGIHEIDGKWYHFGENSGQLKTGWSQSLKGVIYYSNNNGELQKGELFIDNNWYAFNDDFSLKTGWQTVNGKKYYFYADGTKAKYIVKIAGVRYEFSTTGELQHSNVKVIADLSFHNGQIDWDKLWSSGEIDGVILRIGYSLGMDKMFTTYLSEARRLNIPYSVYHFSIAENSYEAQNEASSLLGWYQNNSLMPVYGVFYDIESWHNYEDGHTSNSITVQDYDSIISTYKNILNNKGIYMSLYTGKNYAETRLSDYGREQIDWIAHYATDCGYKGKYRGWQYTSKGHLPGIDGYVDLSIFYY